MDKNYIQGSTVAVSPFEEVTEARRRVDTAATGLVAVVQSLTGESWPENCDKTAAGLSTAPIPSLRNEAESLRAAAKTINAAAEALQRTMPHTNTAQIQMRSTHAGASIGGLGP